MTTVQHAFTNDGKLVYFGQAIESFVRFRIRWPIYSGMSICCGSISCQPKSPANLLAVTRLFLVHLGGEKEVYVLNLQAFAQRLCTPGVGVVGCL